MKKSTLKEPLDYLHRWPIQLWLAGVGIFLYVPIVTLIVYSFNDSRWSIQWKGFTFAWYGKVFQDEALLVAFGNSLTIAAISTAASVVLGALTAVLLWRFRFPGRAAVEGTVALPIVVPEICMGIAMLVFFARVMPWPQDLVWPFNLGAIIIAHITFSFPFVAVVVRARLASFNREQEEAARDLGANDWRIFMDILVPHMMPGLVSGTLLAFTLSLDDFVITFFTAGPETVTFPVKVYSMVRFSVTPEVNAASTVLIVLTLTITVLAMWIRSRSDKKAKADG